MAKTLSYRVIFERRDQVARAAKILGTGCVLKCALLDGGEAYSKPGRELGDPLSW